LLLLITDYCLLFSIIYFLFLNLYVFPFPIFSPSPIHLLLHISLNYSLFPASCRCLLLLISQFSISQSLRFSNSIFFAYCLLLTAYCSRLHLFQRKLNRQIILHPDFFSVLLSGFPFPHQVHDTDNFFITTASQTFQNFNIRYISILFNYE
jgi:hypothetical protein